MKTLPQILSNLVVNYIKPTVEKHKLPVNYYDPRLVRMWGELIYAGRADTRLFRQWLVNSLPE